VSWRSGNSFRRRGDKPNVRIIAAPQPDQPAALTSYWRAIAPPWELKSPVAAGVSPAILSLVTRHLELLQCDFLIHTS
jgi:hypothetical protein